jgi:hypothetical protein
LKFRELKSKYQDALLDNKRLQDRFDSLEFYAKTNNNSSAFHNLIPSTYLIGSANLQNNQTNNTQNNITTNTGYNSTRGRTPAPIAPRQKIATTTSNYNSTNNAYNTTTTPNSYYDSPFKSSSRPTSRQSSVERSVYPSSLANENFSSLINSTYSGSSHRLNDFGNSTIRSRNSSPSRNYDLNDRLSSISNNYSSNWGSIRNLTSLPPHPSYESYTSRSRREPSTERSLRAKREVSQDRSLRSNPSSSLLKSRRSSFVDNPLAKYF